MKLMIINGPNINMLGIREPDIYGKQSYRELCDFIETLCAVEGLEATLYQSNHEGEIVDCIQSCYGVYDGIVINPAAYTHTSIAILDALKAVGLPCVEVHLSEVSAREEFRRVSYAGMACLATFAGKGFMSYKEAILFLKESIGRETDAER